MPRKPRKPGKPRPRVIPSKAVEFCRALHEETGGGLLRYATIGRVAERLHLGEEEAIVLAADCAEADLVRLDVKGPPYRQLPGSAMLDEKGWLLLKRKKPGK
jgi:hypothetical protein